MPLLEIPTQVDGGMGKIGMGIAGTTSSMLPVAALDSAVSVDGMSGGAYQDGFFTYQRERWGTMNQSSGSAFYSRRESGVFDGMALPDHFLRQYYNQVRIITPKNL